MKVFFTIFLCFSISQAYANCEVDGISDSPQALTCTFKGNVLELSCDASTYHLGNEIVVTAWHEDVEEGNSPLLFKTAGRILRVVKQLKGPLYDAELEQLKSESGTCR